MKFIFTILILMASMFARSQSYTVSEIPYNPMPFDSGINVVNYVDDTWSEPIPIGFDFYFFGHPYQSLLLGTNCIVSFDLANENSYCPWPIDNAIPSPLNPVDCIMFPFQDVDPAIGGTIHHQVYGSPPYRKFVLSFDTVPYYYCWDSTFTGQLILYENSGNIEMHLHHKTVCSDWNQGAAILGVQDSSGTEAYWASDYNYPTQWIANDEAWLFSPDSEYAANLDRISGRVIADLDHDCSFGGSDYPLMNKPVVFNDTFGNTFYSFTDMEGYYSKLLYPGSYTFTTANVANQYYSSNCPSGGNYTVNFSNYGDSSDNNLFADTIVNFCSDLQVSMWIHGEPDSVGWFDPLGVCDTGYVELNYQNSGTISDDATLILTLNDSTSVLNSPVVFTSLGNNQYQFELGTLDPGMDSSFSLMIQAGCDTIGTLYCFSSSISGNQYDCSNYNNEETICSQIGVPFDPNAMYVSSSLTPAGFTQFLLTQTTDIPLYTITFQNTGSAAAHNVVIKTLIDSHLNSSSISPGISSYPYRWLVNGDTLIFSFSGINLPASSLDEEGSHGFVRFRIQQGNTSSAGVVIPEFAGIYFDYLSPVSTNTAIVQIENPEGVANTNINDQVLVYPNPITDEVFISSSVQGNYFISDLFGRILATGIIKQPLEINTKSWTCGTYVAIIRTPQGAKVAKLIKE